MMRWVTGTIVIAVIATAIVVGMGAEGKGCEKSAGGDVQSVKIGGKWFHLEIAATDAVRMKGLGQRDHIDADGGMLFVFKDQIRPSAGFVMRDCPIDIDIIYLNPDGHVVSKYEMKAEKPRNPDGSDGKTGEFGGPSDSPESKHYEERLKKYDSRFPMQYAIELKGGTLPGLSIKEGDKIDLPYADLKKRAE